MSSHTYAISSFGTPLDVEWLRHLIIIETPSIAADESEIELEMAPADDPLNLVCNFVPTLTGPQVTQLDAIMSSWSGRPATAPANGHWDDESATLYTTSSYYPTFHTCMDNTVTLDPGTYKAKFEVVDTVSVASESMRSRFRIDGSTVGNIDYHAVQDDDHKSSYTRETEITVATRADVNLKIEFCKTWNGSYDAEIRDQKMVITRKK